MTSFLRNLARPSPPMLWLSEEARLGLVSGAIAVLILMVICMICKLSQLHRQTARKDRNHANGNVPDVEWSSSSQRREEVETECSDCARERTISTEQRYVHANGFEKYSTGTLKLAMVYQTSLKTLFLSVIEADGIVGKDFWDATDSYVKVRLVPDKEDRLRGQTDVYKKSFNPKYQKTFEFDLNSEQLSSLTLHCSVFEIDKFSRNHVLGHATLDIGHVLRPDEPMAFTERLMLPHKVKSDLGEVLFSLSYLPTAERLCIVIMKARNLSTQLIEWQDPKRAINPFVKVLLLFDGKKIKKKKTSSRKQELNPVYNEAMTFDVPPHLLPRLLFVISVADKKSDVTRSDVMGRVVIGSSMTGEALRHWQQMLASPRKPVAAWHRLRP